MKNNRVTVTLLLGLWAALLTPVASGSHTHAAAAPVHESEAGSTAPVYTEDRPLVVGVLLFEGFEPLDVFGPVQIFGAAGPRVSIVTLGIYVDVVQPRFGPAVVAERTLADPGEIDLLLIPGGTGTRTAVDDAEFIAAIKRLAEASPYVATVCTGSGLLARTGLLSGRKATSNKRAFQWAVAQDRSVQWVHAARWIEDGKYATSSGVSAGIDLSLALVTKFFGREHALRVAQAVEYVWNEDAAEDPFAAINAHTAHAPSQQRHPLRGVVVSVPPRGGALVVRHEEIPGVMAAMTMTFKVEAAEIARVHPGDAITAEMFHDGGAWRLAQVEPVAGLSSN